MFMCFSKRGLLSVLLLTAIVNPVLSAKSQPQNDSPVVIRMTHDKKFVPDQVTVRAGQTVEWVSEMDGPSHAITTDPDVAINPEDVSIPKGAKPFNSGTVKSGKSFNYTFTVPGVYHYACPPHEDSKMLGTVTVLP